MTKKSVPCHDALEKLASGKSTGDREYDTFLKKEFKKDIDILKDRHNIIWSPHKLKEKTEEKKKEEDQPSG
jgi:hypothetical protein